MKMRLMMALAVLLSACAVSSVPKPQLAKAPATVLLISVDGLRPADVNASQMPALSALGRAGVRGTMRPSFPSLTFPNHYTVVTGLRPDHHGVVHNQMFDAQLGEFRTSKASSTGNGAWWGGEPIWVSVIRSGARAFTAFWPGSEAAIEGVRPTRWLTFDAKTSAAQLSAQAHAWLNLPQSERARFITVYFPQVDKASHDFGPDSGEARQARAEVDRAIGAIAADIASYAPEDNYNLVVVSDHGFATVSPGQQISTSTIIPTTLATPISDGQVIGFMPKPGKTEDALRTAKASLKHGTCYAKAELPARWHYGHHPRIPAILCQMDKGWDALFPAVFARIRPFTSRGSHGYDPDLPEMSALFIARGPAFAEHRVLPQFNNVHVYSLLMDVLALPAQANDGNPEVLKAAKADPLK